MNTEKIKIILGYTMVCLVWGSTWMAIRIGLDSVSPILSAGFRFLLASAALYIYMKYKRVKIQTDRRSVVLYIILGVFSFVIPFGLSYWGQNYIPSWLASILFAVMPFFVVIFSRIAIPEEKVNSDKIAAMILGFLGIFVIFSKNLSWDTGFSFWGMIAVLLGAVLQAGIAVTVKKYGEHLHPLTMNFIPILICGVTLTLMGLAFEDISAIKLDSKAVVSIVYLAIFGTIVTFTTYYWLLKKINIILLSLTSFVTPIVAVVLGAIFMGEILTSRDLIGSSLVLIAILFANFKDLKNYLVAQRAGAND
ncbi:MAG: EamA family transporter [Ignavibacteria bacterium]|jgi:drug/metabolite transporter (DMT)-like permease|nr:EamA family transporter [Ignavibacteria bacterium]MCU7502451.1 EamA family transporter [Ignavibacteria bacterium]MCU7514984.1 EamA family transporter [Ignavibacteria bacterium]